jgi:hypothetical protein
MKPRPKGGVVVKVHFSGYFEVEPKVLYDYGAFNVSLINDLPLFIDPFGQLRAQFNNYLASQLPKLPKDREPSASVRGACIEAVPGARIGPPPVLRWGCRRPSYEVHHDANGSSSSSRPLGRAPARSLFERHAELADLWRWRDHGRGGQWRVGWRGGLDGRRRRRDDGRGR